MLDTPFYSQRLTEDNYKAEGFDDFSEALAWTKRICGLACLKMVISQLTQEVIPLKTLLNQGLDVDGYMKGVGWIHQGLADIAALYGIGAHCKSIGTHLGVIEHALAQDNLVIASVSCGFNPQKKGGHLVLIIGNKEDAFITHHPSSEEKEQWKHYVISKAVFMQCFSENGNIIIIPGLAA